jgi:MFS family permease
VPYLSFASNFLWVMVIGLWGPSIPAILNDLQISYTQAGLFFTFFAFGSLIGTMLGGIASDHVNRKLLFSGVALVLAVGLICVAFAPSYGLMLLFIFCMSLAGSPAGTVGQSIMLSIFPDRRERYLSLQSVFAALGAFIAPLLVSLNLSLQGSWRWSFLEVAGLAVLLLAAILLLRIPKRTEPATGRVRLSIILKHRGIRFYALLILFSVGPDLGFVYWLAEYFRSEVLLSLSLSSAMVGVFLAGMILSRLGTSQLVKRLGSGKIMIAGLLSALISLLLLLFVPVAAIKVVCVFFYGLSIGPIFPLLMARGTATFPEQSGSVSGLLFASVSLGGMIFPLLFGTAAAHMGIAKTYLLICIILIGLLAAIVYRGKSRSC